MKKEKYQCPCCEQYTLVRPDDFDVCPVCNWEDDNYQKKYPDYGGGANDMSLNQARKAFAEGRKVK